MVVLFTPAAAAAAASSLVIKYQQELHASKPGVFRLPHAQLRVEVAARSIVCFAAKRCVTIL
jgi:hypothetical protein